MTGMLVWGLVAALGLMFVTWLVSLVKKNVSIIDPVWGFAFVLVASVYAVVGGSDGPRQWLVLGLVALWGLRLGIHLTIRAWGKPEDRRYRAMRERRPDTFPVRALVTVFAFQALLVWVVSLPLAAAIHAPDPSGLIWLDLVAVVVFAVGFTFEAVGDWQLARFVKNPDNRGKVMDKGLWRYTRHPNYFGDAVQWWAFTLLALATGAWWTLISPIIMTTLLMRFSGVGLLEKHMNTRPGYKEYAARTNAFFPGPPR